MDKDIKDLTREELEEIASEYEVAFNETVSDDDLRELVTDAMEIAKPLTPEEIDSSDREGLKAIAEGMKLSYASNISTEKLRALIKANLFPSAQQKTAETGGKTIEIWAAEKRTPSWQFAALKQAQNWTSGKTVTEGVYDKGLETLKTRPLGR